MNKGLLVVVSAPSGCGKDTVVSKVLEIMKDDAFLSVSMTTRKMRAGEVDGVNYHFISAEEFKNNFNNWLNKNNKQEEYAKLCENIRNSINEFCNEKERNRLRLGFNQ